MPTESTMSRLLSKVSQFVDSRNGTQPNESATPQSILQAMLLPGENILVIGNVSDGIYWKGVAVFVAAIIFMLLMAVLGLPMPLMILFGVAFLIKLLIMFPLAYLTKRYLLLAATDKRVIVRVGIVNLEIIQLRYAQVESSEVASSIPGRILGYANVYISGTGGRVLAVPFITNAMEFRNAVSEVLSRRDEAQMHLDNSQAGANQKLKEEIQG